jgi:hypothetical protein
MRLRTTGELIFTVREIPSVSEMKPHVLAQLLANRKKDHDPLRSWKVVDSGIYQAPYYSWDEVWRRFTYWREWEPWPEVMGFYWVTDPGTTGHIVLADDLRQCLRDMGIGEIKRRPTRPTYAKIQAMEGIPIQWINTPFQDGGRY